MFETRIEKADQDQRSVQQRSRVMLAATVIARDRSIDVRIRDLSRSGALVECDAALEVGSVVELLRNNNAVRAEIVWARAGRCGIKFENNVVIEEWVGVPARPVRPPEPSRRPDPAPAGLLPTWLVEDKSAGGLDERLSKRVGEELAYIGRLIETIGSDIGSNPAIAHRHSGSIQNCRLAKMLLSEIATVLLAEDRAKAAAGIRTPELKARLLRS